MNEQNQETNDDELDSHLVTDRRRYGNDSEKLRNDFGKVSEKLSGLVSAIPLPAEEIIRTLEDYTHLFLLHLDQNFGKASE